MCLSSLDGVMVVGEEGVGCARGWESGTWEVCSAAGVVVAVGREKFGVFTLVGETGLIIYFLCQLDYHCISEVDSLCHVCQKGQSPTSSSTIRAVPVAFVGGVVCSGATTPPPSLEFLRSDRVGIVGGEGWISSAASSLILFGLARWGDLGGGIM